MKELSLIWHDFPWLKRYLDHDTQVSVLQTNNVIVPTPQTMTLGQSACILPTQLKSDVNYFSIKNAKEKKKKRKNFSYISEPFYFVPNIDFAVLLWKSHEVEVHSESCHEKQNTRYHLLLEYLQKQYFFWKLLEQTIINVNSMVI